MCLGNSRHVFAENTLQIGIDQYDVSEEEEPIEEISKIDAKINKHIVIGILLFIVSLIIALILFLSRKQWNREEASYESIIHTAATDFSEPVSGNAEWNRAGKGKEKIKVTLFRVGTALRHSLQR